MDMLFITIWLQENNKNKQIYENHEFFEKTLYHSQKIQQLATEINSTKK